MNIAKIAIVTKIMIEFLEFAAFSWLSERKRRNNVNYVEHNLERSKSMSPCLAEFWQKFIQDYC